jgi:hypothetical protein
VLGALGHALPEELVAAGAHTVAGALEVAPGGVGAEDGAAVGLAAALGPLVCEEGREAGLKTGSCLRGQLCHQRIGWMRRSTAPSPS